MDILTVERDEMSLLVDLWERSVRATHDFLSEQDLLAIKADMLNAYFHNVELFVARTGDNIVGFMGLAGGMIEMLFVDAGYQGRGVGSALIAFALKHGATSVDVNEQNQKALSFYLKSGFTVVGRDDFDSDGRPYPILHLSYGL